MRNKSPDIIQMNEQRNCIQENLQEEHQRAAQKRTEEESVRFRIENCFQQKSVPKESARMCLESVRVR